MYIVFVFPLYTIAVVFAPTKESKQITRVVVVMDVSFIGTCCFYMRIARVHARARARASDAVERGRNDSVVALEDNYNIYAYAAKTAPSAHVVQYKSTVLSVLCSVNLLYYSIFLWCVQWKQTRNIRRGHGEIFLSVPAVVSLYCLGLLRASAERRESSSSPILIYSPGATIPNRFFFSP